VLGMASGVFLPTFSSHVYPRDSFHYSFVRPTRNKLESWTRD
jgi:hypothetical protein